MRIFSLVYAAYLLRFCSCGDFVDESTLVSAWKDGQEVSTDVPSPPGMLDISVPDEEQCKSFDYTFAGNAIRLIVPNKDTTATKLVNGAEEDAYTLPSGETLDHAKAYLNKDKKPELVLLVFNTPSGISRRDYVKSDNGWTVCNNSDIKMRSLRDPAEWISNFEIDVSLANGTDEFTAFEAELLGIAIQHFFPKPGHAVV
ncbi:signal peptide-containing protein [Theileria equi strain WA]|uniref:Signal peptide-containing protein n=1 Tax=Theileria equi strain WA TaxID=1537102 RepID=L0AVF7_THEEQ|nr:signal peptide-containing protein [Theileria equi strain WA]AFZ79592.1 signal peptide-containing protein [Theileria equi strain WA]|eukprot:XP_004829258.1 signal peptide-containing protein [Theileria equi strain WA]